MLAVAHGSHASTGLLPLSLDLGAARAYTGFFVDDFTSIASDTEGRLAAGGDLSVNHYSVGDRLRPGISGPSVLVGGDLSFPNGRVYHGDIVVGGSAAGLGMPVIHGLSPSQSVLEYAELPVDFTQTAQRLAETSAALAALPANGSAQWQ